MFRNSIRNTPFTSQVANEFFSNIRGTAYENGDISFLSTLRALVAPRMDAEDQLDLAFRVSTYSAPQPGISVAEEKSMLLNIYGGVEDMPNTIYIHNFRRGTDDDGEWMKLVKKHFCKMYKDWAELDKVPFFFKKAFEVLCFVNPTIKSVVLFTNNMDMRKMHYLQCGIFAFLPWYFNPEDGVSEEEMELINSLRENTDLHYAQCLDKMIEKYDLRTQKIQRCLRGFENRYERAEAQRIEQSIASLNTNIADYNRRIGDCFVQKRDLETRLLGYQLRVEQEGETSEIMEYFLCNKRLVLESVDDNTMVFGVKDYITYFDEDMAKRAIENEGSYIYRPRGRSCDHIFSAKDISNLMRAIFLDQTLRIRVCAAYSFRIGGNVTARSGYSYGSEYNGYMPNVHIDRFSCMGGYERQINELLQNNDYVGAIEQCIASCKSLNFHDSTVLAEFMSRWYGTSDRSTNIRCIELPNGEIVDPKGAIEYLKQEETNG